MRTAIVCVTVVLLLGAGCRETNPTLPAKGVFFPDSLYNASLARITDKTADGYSGPGIENEYARSDAENCDGSRVILRGQDGEWYLYGRPGYAMLKHFTDLGMGEEPEPRWDASAPNLFFYLFGPELRQYDITGDTFAAVHDFRTEYYGASFISTKTEGDASLDRRYWCFMVEDSVFNVLAVVCYDRELDSVVGAKTSFPDGINWVSMDMSGSRCVIGYESSPAQVFSRDFATMLQLPAGATGHMDLAWTIDSTDVMVFQSNTTDSITMVDLNTGAATPLLAIPFDVSTDIGLHFSGNCAATPGWCLVSTYGAENPLSGEAHSWMDNLLFMVELKADPRVVKLCRTRCYTGKNPQSNYFAEAYATVNRAGTRVYFGSNWGDYMQDYTDAYEVDLPSGWNE
jgi:hypothetical protein